MRKSILFLIFFNVLNNLTPIFCSEIEKVPDVVAINIAKEINRILIEKGFYDIEKNIKSTERKEIIDDFANLILKEKLFSEFTQKFSEDKRIKFAKTIVLNQFSMFRKKEDLNEHLTKIIIFNWPKPS